MNSTEWRKRIKHRNDISSRITHLTKGVDNDDAFQNLLKILIDKKIKGSTTSSGFIIGSTPAVCLQEAPLNAIAENLLYEEKLINDNNSKIRYFAFGLRFNKILVYKKGGRPVIYEESKLMKKMLKPEEHWRIVDFELADKNSVTDWSHEREWRVPNELTFEYKYLEIILPSAEYYKEFINYCIDNNRTDILTGINGIITLNSIFY